MLCGRCVKLVFANNSERLFRATHLQELRKCVIKIAAQHIEVCAALRQDVVGLQLVRNHFDHIVDQLADRRFLVNGRRPLVITRNKKQN